MMNLISLKSVLASKIDFAEMETRIEKRMLDINKTIYVVGLIQFLAIVGSVLAIVNFAIK